MINVIYRGVITPAHESPDGETPDCVIVTQEVNGYAIWRQNWDETICAEFSLFGGRDYAIERAVKIKTGILQRAGKL